MRFVGTALLASLSLHGSLACGGPGDTVAGASAGATTTASATTGGSGGAPDDVGAATTSGPRIPATTGGSSMGEGGSGGTVCAAGTIQCSGATPRICDGDGGFTEMVDCAASAQICVEGLGCRACAPGTGSCDGPVGRFCLGDGSGFGVDTCDPFQGMECNPGSGRCDGACGKDTLGKSYIGCDYYPTVTANTTNSAAFHFAVAVSNTTTTPAAVTVSQGAATIAVATVGPNSVQVIPLPWNETLKGPSSLVTAPFPASVAVPQGAFRLRATQPVTVYQFNPLEYASGAELSYSNDASLLLPTNAWTGSYRVVARHHFNASSGFYAVTAREDNTTVTVLPGPGGGLVKPGIPGISASGSGEVVLDAGDVIEVVTDGAGTPSDPDDVTGTLVSADKPVQVIAGHQCTFIPDDTPACDHLEESMFPYETLAQSYLVSAPLVPDRGGTPKAEMVRIVATAAGTTLTYDPPQPMAPTSIDAAGGWVEIASTTASFAVSADHPILVAQYMEGQDLAGAAGDPSMSLAVATSQYRSSYLFHAPPNYTSSYVNITAPLGAKVLLDGQPVSKESFSAIGSTGFGISRQPLSNAGDGNHAATSASPFGITVYGYGQYTSYWYPGGSNFTALHP